MVRRSSRSWQRAAVAAAAAACLAFPASAFGGSLFVIQGGGWGNGVGLSQWGAEGYARHGWAYRAILAHYYPHTTLAKVGGQDVRVLLADGKSRLAVGSAAPFVLVDARGHTVHVPARELRFTTHLRLGEQALVPPVTVYAGASPLTLDGAGYRGSLVLDRAPGGLSAVNVVPIERYLRGVVPSEMPHDWHAGAYAAQAVAARSYALSQLKPAAAFDLFADTRDQVYGGIAAERPATNGAVGDTAGLVLEYGGQPIVAYYGSSSGGRTAAVQDVLTKQAPEPYLVPVRDPYDGISPNHSWRVVATAEGLSRRLGLAVEDVRLVHNDSGRVSSALVVGARGGERTVSGRDLQHALGLRSSYFAIAVVSLAPPPRTAVFAQPVRLEGFVRGTTGVVVQAQLPNGAWRQVRRVVARADGRFTATIRPHVTTAYRLAVDRIGGPPAQIEVARRIAVHAEGRVIAGHVVPAAPVRVERLTPRGWHAVAGVPVGPSGAFRVPLAHGGSYRVSSAGSGRYLASASRAVSVRSGARAAGTSALLAGSPALGMRASRHP